MWFLLLWMVVFFVFTLLSNIDTDPYDWVAAKTWTVCYEIESLPWTVKHKVFFHSKDDCKKYINSDFY